MRRIKKMTKALKYGNVLTARVSDADFRAVCERADEEELTRSEYLRYVVRLVADDAGMRSAEACCSTGAPCAGSPASSSSGGTTTTRGCTPSTPSSSHLTMEGAIWSGCQASSTSARCCSCRWTKDRADIAKRISSLEARAIVGGD